MYTRPTRLLPLLLAVQSVDVGELVLDFLPCLLVDDAQLGTVEPYLFFDRYRNLFRFSYRVAYRRSQAPAPAANVFGIPQHASHLLGRPVGFGRTMCTAHTVTCKLLGDLDHRLAFEKPREDLADPVPALRRSEHPAPVLDHAGRSPTSRDGPRKICIRTGNRPRLDGRAIGPSGHDELDGPAP